MFLLPVSLVVGDNFQMERLETILLVDGHFTGQGLDSEGNDSLLCCGNHCKEFFILNDMLQLSAHKDAAQEPV